MWLQRPGPRVCVRLRQRHLIPPGVTQVYLHDDEWQIGKNGYGHAAILGAIRPTLALLGDAVEQHPDRDQPAVAQRTARLQSADAERRRARDERVRMADSAPPDARPTGDDVARALGRLQPAMPAPMMLADEAISDQDSFHQYCHFDTPNSYFNAQGGSLGISMPAAMGMKLGAGTTRTVVNTVGDGTALFYPHSWWTATKFKLPVLYLVTNNREYKTLQLGEQAIESTYGWRPAGRRLVPAAGQPADEFRRLSRPFGVDGTLVSSGPSSTMRCMPGWRRSPPAGPTSWRSSPTRRSRRRPTGRVPPASARPSAFVGGQLASFLWVAANSSAELRNAGRTPRSGDVAVVAH